MKNNTWQFILLWKLNKSFILNINFIIWKHTHYFIDIHTSEILYTINKYTLIPRIGGMFIKYSKYYVVIWLNKNIMFILW
jgi:hypothetical protein